MKFTLITFKTYNLHYKNDVVCDKITQKLTLLEIVDGINCKF